MTYTHEELRADSAGKRDPVEDIGGWTASELRCLVEEYRQAPDGAESRTAAVNLAHASLTALPALLDEVERLTGTHIDLNGESIMEARRIPHEAGVPTAAFFDDHVHNACILLKDAERRAEAAESRVAELEKGLEPFAAFIDGIDRRDAGHKAKDDDICVSDDCGALPVDFHLPTFGDLRRARALLKGGQSDG